MDSFYRAFEDRYRGSRELIKDRLSQYLPFVRPLAALYPGEKTFDLGCGRGEWLELMSEAGFAPTGADLDTEMLEACRERGLPAFQGDAIEHLTTLDSDSHALISAFHVVEHVDFDQLRKIVDEALRVLKPGGILILETPNPENIATATNNFYLDPSHRNPVPPLLLSFVAEHAGFDRVKIVRLQESAALKDAAARVHLVDIVEGASPDYAVVAQKNSGSTEDAFDDAFNTGYGLTVEALAQRYETQLASNISHVEARVQQAEESVRRTGEQWVQLGEQLQAVAEQLQLAEARYQEVENRMGEAQSRLQQTEAVAHEAEAKAHEAEAKAHQASAQLHAVYKSTSWRVTAPMRLISLTVRGKGLEAAKPSLKALVRRGSRFAKNRPWALRIARGVLNRMPRLKARLVPIVAASMAGSPGNGPVAPQLPENLDNHAGRIYAQLIAAIERLQQERN